MFKVRVSLESKAEAPNQNIENFSRQFQLGKGEGEAVEWGWDQEMGDTMFIIVNAYTRAAQFEGLSVEVSYRL
jgi:hypothetical protein